MPLQATYGWSFHQFMLLFELLPTRNVALDLTQSLTHTLVCQFSTRFPVVQSHDAQSPTSLKLKRARRRQY